MMTKYPIRTIDRGGRTNVRKTKTAVGPAYIVDEAEYRRQMQKVDALIQRNLPQNNGGRAAQNQSGRY